jgi:hypothetical protein
MKEKDRMHKAMTSNNSLQRTTLSMTLECHTSDEGTGSHRSTRCGAVLVRERNARWLADGSAPVRDGHRGTNQSPQPIKAANRERAGASTLRVIRIAARDSSWGGFFGCCHRGKRSAA